MHPHFMAGSCQQMQKPYNPLPPTLHETLHPSQGWCDGRQWHKYSILALRNVPPASLLSANDLRQQQQVTQGTWHWALGVPHPTCPCTVTRPPLFLWSLYITCIVFVYHMRVTCMLHV